MTSGKSWSTRDLDPRIRKMAQEAARQAGMSLEDWIRAAVEQQAATEEAPAAGSGRSAFGQNDESEASLASIGDRIRSMSPQPRPRRTAAEQAELDEIVRRIAREFQNADETARSAVEGAEESGASDFDDDPGFSDTMAEAAPVIPRARPERRRDARRDRGAQRQHGYAPDAAMTSMGGGQDRRGPPRPPVAEPLAPRKAAADPLSAAIADISHRQSFLAGRSPVAEGLPAEIGALRADVMALADRIASLTEWSMQERGGQDGSTHRLEKATLASQASMATIAATLGDIRLTLDDLAIPRGPDASDFSVLAMEMAELRAKIDGVERNGRQSNESLRRLESRVETMARVDPAALVRGVEVRIDRLATQVETLLRAPSRTGALDDIRSEIASVRLELATRGSKGMDAIEKRIRDLIEHMTETSRSNEARHLAALESRIDTLAADLARTTPRAAVLEQIEASIADLRDSIADGREDAAEAARAAARLAVSELHTADGSGALVDDLRKDLDSIRALIAETNRTTRIDENAVKAALAAVAERLDSLPDSFGDDSADGDDPDDDTFISAVADEPVLAEPAESRRDLGLVREVASSVTLDERMTPDRRADFIAAARRAMQAAMAEAGPGAHEPEAALATAGGASPFARIGQAIRARRRPLLLAAAALVLAIGALQMFSRPMANAEIDRRTTASITSDAPAHDGLPIPSAGELAATAPRTVGVVEPFASASAVPDVPNVGSEDVRAAAAAGDPVAAYEIANRLADGRGTLRDLGQAALWYQRAADAGVVPAMYRLASLYERGQGVPKDLRQAMALYQRAAEQGNPGSMYNLAVLLNSGALGAPDRQAAMHWFRAAADYGVTDSQYNLGIIHSRGLDVPVDGEEAYKWFALAAAAGDPDAATQRDQIGARLGPNALSRARAEVGVYRPKAPPPGAADVTAVPAAAAAATDAPEPPVGMSFESRQAMVRTAQSLLIERGYDPGPADGLEGPKTVQAVRAFQRSIGVASNGQIDETLVARLSERIG